jgi:DNA-binding CsgD family transcriptional regulator
MRAYKIMGRNKFYNQMASSYIDANEFWVLYYFYTGLSVKAMAAVLGMSIKMISYYKRKVMRRLHLKTDKELSAWLVSKKYTTV